MPRPNAWTLKALRALLACLCVFFALPAASSGDPALRPVAAALAGPSAVAATVTTEAHESATSDRAVRSVPVSAVPQVGRAVAPAPDDVVVPDGRRLYLENSALLC